MTGSRKRDDHQTVPERPKFDTPDDGSRPSLDGIDEQALAELYSGFTDEDRALANVGLAEYAGILSALDKEQ
jgi:hypothetical protein